MEIKNKHIFWEALILAIFIFIIGIFLGYLMEKNRTSQLVSLYQQSELDLLDLQIQENALSLRRFDCNIATSELINFANRVYDEARLLERYEGANEFSKEIIIQHKKYDLLRALLWVDSIGVKERCNESFDNLVYFYNYQSADLDVISAQNVMSKKLLENKTKYGEKIILIPIAGNLNISSIDYLKSSYNITSIPAILVNEKIIIDDFNELDKLESYLF